MGGTGFVLEDSDDNLILNCDSHHNGDGLTPTTAMMHGIMPMDLLLMATRLYLLLIHRKETHSDIAGHGLILMMVLSFLVLMG